MGIESERTLLFDAGVDALWASLGRVGDYRSWWPWLRDFDARALETGDRWRCTVQPPVPYTLNFTIELAEVVAAERVAAHVSGDITGHATLTLRPAGDGSELRLVSSLEPRRPLLSMVTNVTPWLARVGHDWVLDTGQRQFRRRAL